MARLRVRGNRHIVAWHPALRRTCIVADVTLEPAWAAGFAMLARPGLSSDLQCRPGQITRSERTASAWSFNP